LGVLATIPRHAVLRGGKVAGASEIGLPQIGAGWTLALEAAPSKLTAY